MLEVLVLEKNFDEMLKYFKEFIQKIEHYNNTIGLLHWDLSTGAPEKGVTERAAIIGMLASEAFQMSTSIDMEQYLNYFSESENNEKLDNIMEAVIKECRKDFDRFKKIPQEKYREYVQLTSEAQSVWEKAKNTDDFSLFSPYLEKIVNFNIEFIELWGYEGNKYNTLLDYYEPGMSVEKLDKIFKDLRNYIVSLLSRMKEAKDKPDDTLLKQYFNLTKQKKVCRDILQTIGYDFKAGRLDESEHPFTIGINPGDVRVTTHYYPENFSSAFFSSLHEGGHGLYEQNIDKNLIGTPLYTGTSLGIHESQSRFWENMVGRSFSFWKYYYNQLSEVFPDELKEIALEDFYRAINKVEPTLIRVEADELTYNLHIMIRYEIEKALINQEIKVSDLPAVWKEKMKEYLGIEPANDKEGVLQDVHWSSGLMGYFPSYTLGNIYAAQFYNTLKKEINNLDKLISNGELLPIKEWLGEQIHKYGKLLSPSAIIKQVTGEESNSKYLIEYLEDKFTRIYKL